MTKDNSGNLFNNTFTEEGTKQPDYKGEVMINGTMMKASLWVNKDKNGNPYFGLGFQSLEDVAKYSKANSNSTPKPKFENDDIPF